MKKAAVLAFALVFAACMFHFFYAEDHCPVHCPSQGGRFGHVHPHHAAQSICLCFWTSLVGPETDDFAGANDFMMALARPADSHLLVTLGADITHPPKSSLA
jgi:hypothetical protein